MSQKKRSFISDSLRNVLNILILKILVNPSLNILIKKRL